jgi:hypothetical protein
MKTQNRREIFQIYFTPDMLTQCDPVFTPLDNTANPCPDIREWYIFEREHQRLMATDLTHWGFFSWRFGAKSNLSGQQVYDFIDANPGHDVYLFNPFPGLDAVFANLWEQSACCNMPLGEVTNKFLQHVGYQNVNVDALFLDYNYTCSCSFVVASRTFWTGYLQFSKQIFQLARVDEDFRQKIFVEPSGYAQQPGLCRFSFINERLLCTFAYLEQFSTCAYRYNQHTIKPAYLPMWSKITALADLKHQAFEKQDQELLNKWVQDRNVFVSQHPEIFTLS